MTRSVLLEARLLVGNRAFRILPTLLGSSRLYILLEVIGAGSEIVSVDGDDLVGAARAESL